MKTAKHKFLFFHMFPGENLPVSPGHDENTGKARCFLKGLLACTSPGGVPAWTHITILALCVWLSTVIAATEVDFDIAAGKKPLPLIFNYNSRFTFPVEQRELRRYFSAYTDELPQTDIKSNLLRLRRNDEVFEFQDFDGNGLIDTWRRYLGGSLEFEAKLHESKKVISQKTWFRTDGGIAEVWLDPHHRGSFTEINIYRDARIIKTLRDENEDGLHEIEILYLNSEGPEKQSNVMISELQRAPLPPSEPLVFAGIYRADEEPQFEPEITKAITQKLESKLSNSYLQSEAIANHLYSSKKNQGQRLYHRFQIFRSTALTLGRRDFHGYILTGEIYQSPARTTLHFRIIGPEAKSLLYSAILEYSSRDFNKEMAAEAIAQAIQSLWKL